MKTLISIVIGLLVVGCGKKTSKPEAKANLEQFRKEVEPVLKWVCVECHEPKKQKGKFRPRS